MEPALKINELKRTKRKSKLLKLKAHYDVLEETDQQKILTSEEDLQREFWSINRGLFL